MRTLEQIIEDEYANLTYGELSEYDLGCDVCPLYNEFCPGGIVCYGGMPIEPPCCCFDDDTNLDEEYLTYSRQERYLQELEDKREKELALKQQKSEERKRKLREYKIRNSSDLYEIKILKRKIQIEKKKIDKIGYIQCFANAINDTNKMFRECHQPNNVADVDTKEIDDYILICKNNINNYESQISEIRQKIKTNEKLRKKQIL